eukprot:CAMPEP_0198324268 /NCGR_PEP_ID=MMETSP1450-20131203/12324_1 /TAXON_ID=753684 ORGANISM="Madagascaria erythrocladiodes, Strain CCMP3234" /NCGR_SAMPLE_ID=MMETSP1450 /ASSEMBLY_ACC=CAM_ASM_001115 /LENGTH=177 /DNA_ID=CAMNT_0044028051 /DNA_START=372 /DNA_END=906 /DNA_ORIENTATION=+
MVGRLGELLAGGVLLSELQSETEKRVPEVEVSSGWGALRAFLIESSRSSMRSMRKSISMAAAAAVEQATGSSAASTEFRGASPAKVANGGESAGWCVTSALAKMGSKKKRGGGYPPPYPRNLRAAARPAAAGPACDRGKRRGSWVAVGGATSLFRRPYSPRPVPPTRGRLVWAAAYK